MTEPQRTSRTRKPAPLASAAMVGEDREVTAETLAESIGPDPDHEARLDVAHRCAERDAGHALPKILSHDHAQGVQRLAEWLAFTGRGLDGVLPAEDEIPAVVRYHWRLAGN